MTSPLKTGMVMGAAMLTMAGCTTTERTVGGAVVGGTGGAVIGNAIGGSGGAVIGGLAGGTAGALVGRDMGRQRDRGYYR